MTGGAEPAIPAGSAVLLVGHGSHLSPASSLPVHSLADEVRRLGGDLEVRVAFWKEEPLLHHAFALVESDRVFVVPVFTSEGYFTDTVLPRELGLEGEETYTDGRVVHYCAPVGSHPSMASIVLARAEELASETGGEDDTVLVVVGHGTERHPRSARTTRTVAEAIRDTGRFSRVEAAFLDQAPLLDDVLAALGSVRVIVVPFFMSEGWHAGTTIPRDLGAIDSGSLHYSQAVGTHPMMADVVLDLLRDAGERTGAAVQGPPALAGDARRAFIEWIRASGPAGREFLETAVWEGPDGRFEIRNRADRGADPAGLATFEDPGDGGAITRTTDDGTYRPLSTSPDLRRGWRIVDLDARGVWEAFAGIYPTAPVHWYLGRRGDPPTIGFEEAAGRQTGMYEPLGSLGSTAVGRIVADLCEGRCLRVPRWPASALPLVGDEGAVPCLQPCSVFLSHALKGLDGPDGSG